MVYLRKLLILILILISQNVWSQKIRMVTTSWEPFYSPSLSSGGVVTELVQTAFIRAGHKTSISWYPWVRALTMVEHGISDVVMGAFYSAERNEKFYFSDPIFSVDVGLVALKSISIEKYKDLKSLESYQFGVIRGWVYSNKFDAAKFLKKKKLANQVIAVKMLFNKKVDIVAVTIPVFKHEAKQLKQNSQDFFVLEPLLDSKSLYLMFNKKSPLSLDIVNDFNRGMVSIRADGTFNKIIEKHNFLDISNK